MGRKGQANKSKPSLKTKNSHNLKQQEKELQESVDKLLRVSTIPQQQNVLKALEGQKEISSIIQTIQKLEKNKEAQVTFVNCRNTSTSSDIIDKFTHWVRVNGALFEGCSISAFPDYDLGLKANVDVPIGSLFVAVPRTLMLTSESAENSILKDFIKNDQILKNMPNVCLAMLLLVEKYTDNSFFKPYIDILPQTYRTVLYFTDNELEELKGSPTLEIALKQVKSISRQYAYFKTIFTSRDDPVSKMFRDRFTFEEYRWAVSTVMTRQNTIPSEDGLTMINALIPLWDLCNHNNGKLTTDYNPLLNRSECLALRDFKAGEQIFIFYGPRSNADLFIHNGFVFESNEHDGYYIRLGISKSDSLQEKRKKLLAKISLDTTNDFNIKKCIESIGGDLLSFLRVFNMNEEQLTNWIESEKSSDLQYVECALDTALEKKSWTYLQDRLKLLLATYKTTLEEDLELIKENKLSPNKLLATRMRATEKNIIKDALLYVEQYINQ